MVNEIDISIWLVFVVIDIVLILIAFLGKDLENHANIICSVLGTTLTFILSHSILNGNVVMLKSDDTFKAIQSLPLFYFMEGLAVLMVIYTGFLIYNAISEKFEKHSVFGSGD